MKQMTAAGRSAGWPNMGREAAEPAGAEEGEGAGLEVAATRDAVKDRHGPNPKDAGGHGPATLEVEEPPERGEDAQGRFAAGAPLGEEGCDRGLV